MYRTFEQYNTSNQCKEEVQQFFVDVTEHDFYETIRQELNLNNRNQAKIFCFSIIFSKPDSTNEFKKIIRDKYPSIIDTLDDYKSNQMEKNKDKKRNKNKKKKGYEKLAINLQALESEIFIDGIFKELNNQGISCFTRHDGLIVGESDRDKALIIANEYYKTLGLTPKFKVENYNQTNDVDSYIISFPEEFNFIDDINIEQDVNNLDKDMHYSLLKIGEQILPNNEYLDLESSIMDLDNRQSLNSNSITLLFNISEYINKVILCDQSH